LSQEEDSDDDVKENKVAKKVNKTAIEQIKLKNKTIKKPCTIL